MALLTDVRMLKCAIILHILVSIAVQVDASHFYNPPAAGTIGEYSTDVSFTVGSTVTLNWSTTYPTALLTIWQNIGNPGEMVQLFSNGEQKYDWLVQTGFDLADGEIFYFNMYNGTTVNSQFFNSHYFNITAAAASSISTAPTSSYAKSTITTASSTPVQSHSAVSANTVSTLSFVPTSATSTIAAAVASHSSDSTSMSMGARAGIGVGVTIAALVIFGSLVLLVIHRRKTGQPGLLAKSLHEIATPAELQCYGPAEMEGKGLPAEIRGEERYEIGVGK